MDAIALQTLRKEMVRDCEVALDAFRTAAERFEHREEIAYDSSAHHLCRMYNVFEQMGIRVTKVFENNLGDEQGWHSALLSRLTIRIDGVRPALIPQELKQPLRELKDFRHVWVHAYDLELDPAKLSLLLGYARKVAERLPQLVEQFIRLVAQEQGLDIPE